MGCNLCESKKTLNGVMFIGRNIFVMECKSCHVPIAVSIDHKKEFTAEEKSFIHEVFYKHLRLQGVIDWKTRDIKDHVHAHLR